MSLLKIYLSGSVHVTHYALLCLVGYPYDIAPCSVQRHKNQMAAILVVPINALFVSFLDQNELIVGNVFMNDMQAKSFHR